MSMFTDAALELRVHFAEAMSDTVTVDRTSAAGAFSTAAGTYAGPTVSSTTGITALIRYGDHTRPDFGQEAADRDVYTLYTPFDTDLVREDRITVTASALDADLVGDVLIVKSVDQGTWNVRKAAVCELET